MQKKRQQKNKCNLWQRSSNKLNARQTKGARNCSQVVKNLIKNAKPRKILNAILFTTHAAATAKLQQLLQLQPQNVLRFWRQHTHSHTHRKWRTTEVIEIYHILYAVCMYMSVQECACNYAT